VRLGRPFSLTQRRIAKGEEKANTIFEEKLDKSSR
jgi:hypothetical protein